MLISVVIPTYMPQKYYFEECLFSLFNQTLSPNLYEIIVVLNGEVEAQSEEMVAEICAYKPEGLNCKLLKTTIASVSNARNIGINISQGQYICFVDDDDIVSSKYLEDLLRVSEKNIIGVSNVHTFINSIENKADNFFACKVIQREKHYNSLFRNRSILAFPVAKLIHRDIIGERRFNPRFKNGEDALFMTEISNRIAGFSFTQKSTVYYVRERVGSASRKVLNRFRLFEDTFALLKSYILIFISSPFSYNLLLFLSRIPGVIKGAIKLSRNKSFIR